MNKLRIYSEHLPKYNTDFCKVNIFIQDNMVNNEEEILKTIGKKILEKRKLKGMTQDTLADYANIDRTYIGYIENGKQNITISMLCKIANVLETPIIELLK